MIVELKYTNSKFEKPTRCGFSPNFNEKVEQKPCACEKPLPNRTKRHLMTIPVGKRYFGFERCAPSDYLPAKPSSPKELREFYRPQCCGCKPK